MPLSPGTKLGQYEVVEAIGAGGMGEVYRARDTKLGRDVAIKVLPEEFARDQERLDRFEREARLLAQVNHANIATLYGLEEHDGQRFLVMELVEGETLAERIAKGRIPLDEAIPLFIQIAEGLEAAHQKGIIHRDLKPANIKIGLDGKPKILDFGLAKAFVGEPLSPADSSQSPTLTKGTAIGVIMGTAGYMSPEQARGLVVDKRTDIWAFGCVLFEALTGRVAFPGETLSDTIANVLKQEPEWESLPDETPAWLRVLLRRCLRKDPERRLRDIGDARLEIEDAPSDGTEDFVPAKIAAKPQRFLPWILAGLMTAVAFWAVAHLERDPQVVRTSIVLPPEEDPSRFTIAISPDGAHVVYSATYDNIRGLYLRSLHEGERSPIPGTEGGRSPFFSPDGDWVGFVADGLLKKVRLDGVGAVTVGESACCGGSWGPGDNIVFALTRSSGLMKVSADGGRPEALTTLDLDEKEQTHRWPQVLPNGKAVLFTSASGGSFDEASIVAVLLSTRERRFLTRGSYARYVSTGHLVYGRGATLYAVPFDPDRLEVKGNGVPVQVGVSSALTGRSDFAVSESGTLIFAPARVTDRRLVLVDLEGRIEPLAAPPLDYGNVQFSADGGQLVSITDDGNVHLYELEHQRFSLLFSSLEDRAGRVWTPFDLNWSPDGTHFAVSARFARYGARLRDVHHTGWRIDCPHARRIESCKPVDPGLVSRRKAASLRGAGNRRQCHPYLGATSRARGRPEGHPHSRFRPDALPGWPLASLFLMATRWGGERDLRETVRRRWQGPSDLRRWREGIDLGSGWAHHLLSQRGKNDGRRAQLRCYVLCGNAPSAIRARRRFFPYGFDLSPDGQKFVMIQDAPEPTVTQIHVVQNWTEELERLVPIQ